MLFPAPDRPIVGGLQPLTMIDFPGRIACVLFLQGCNLRCRYCHNPELVKKAGDISHPWHDILGFLDRRRGFLEGVVFSGGEPTFQDTLRPAVEEIRDMGFEVALHTNGAFPLVLGGLLRDRLLSFVALDIKAPPGHYHEVTGAPIDAGVRESARLLIESGVAHEFRTTVHPSVISQEWVMAIGDFLQALGAKRFILQKCREGKTLDPQLPPVGPEWLGKPTLDHLRRQFSGLAIRGDPTRFQDLAA
ncbi:MAG: Ribonucleotide reductase of class III (anaerobic), activating protein [Candidatus Ozemobacter sibiricus]|jgi:pyruvate formate lyase activating enzyme|uniref:Ribonucleotide reductase of class III (Anaerobic), activating protein n=1 Tax=Candidatus Ozemobacter sibiricus TaxID=2268124 RepID=A0A367ZT51_9BACT|nr:MAG: Ribonucleotide reductase of class III (anaerobic), activating protein [Candidatus Ozemobacter sibiricus]